MNPFFLFALCLGTFACLLPLTAYCLVLAYLNNRRQPTSASGSWDAIGVLLALSGFLLIGGPVLLTAADSAVRGAWVSGSGDQLVEAIRASGAVWVYLWLGYLMMLVVLTLGFVMARRPVTVIYQLEPDLAAPLLAESARATGREVRERPDMMMILPRPDDTRPGMSPPGADGTAATWVRIDLFRGAKHVTLTWQGDPLTRREVEAELDRRLAQTTAASSPAAGWLMTVASFLFFVLLFCLMFVMLQLFSAD